MSFWGIWKRSSAKESVDKGPLALIEKAWIELIRDERLLQDFEGSKAPSKIARDILNISDIISTEERSGNRQITHLCGLSIIQESVAAFSVLIKSGEEDLMSNDQVIQSINVFLCELYKAKGDRILEDEFSEMLFSVASRLRAEPQSIIKWIRMPEHSGENSPIDSHGVGSRSSTYLGPVNERGNNADDEDLPELIYELPNDSSDEISVQDEGSNTEEADHGDQTDTQTTPKASRINNQDAYFSSVDENGNDDFPSTPKAPNGDTVNDETGDNYQAPVKSTEVSSRSSVQQEQYATPEESPQTNSTLDTPRDANNHDSNESSQNQEDDVEHNINEASMAIDSLLTDLQIDQRRNDFPLFHFLLDFIYHDGKSGEFSRTGIIFIVESAHPGSSLEKWILDSDFGTLMASGLGALYSQLSRRLFRAFQSDQEPKIVAVAKESERKYIGSSNDDTAIGPETAEELERNEINLEIFLSYLEFWQDTLSHCKSALIRANLLEKFDTLFLRQLLLPSLVETMDVNNSDLSVAVMTYLRAIFDTLQQKDIVEIILSCLITSDRSETTNGDKEGQSTSQFNMVRMIIDGLDTPSQQTVGSSLRLISSLVRRHYPYVLNTIFSVKSLSDSFQPTVTPFNVYAKELEFLLDLLPEGEETSEIESQAYDNYLKESRRIIESHAYLPKNLLSAEMSLSREASDQSRLFKHSMNNDDQTWTRLLRLLSQFFANSVELNLILTRVFIDLASCGWMSLRGWMLVDLENVKSSCGRPRRRRGPDTKSFDETLNETKTASSEMEDDVEKDIDLRLLAEYASDMSYSSSDDDYDEYWGMNSNDRFETTSFTEISPMMEVLSALSKKIESFETKIPNFYDRLAEHRELIRDAEDVIPDVDVSAYSSPVVRQKDIVQRVETRTFSLSPVDTQRRAEELWYSSSSLPSSPAPMRFSSVPSPLTGELRTGVLSRSNTVQRQQRIPSLPPHFSSSPLTLPKRGARERHLRTESLAGDFFSRSIETLPYAAARVQTHRRVQSSALSIRTSLGDRTSYSSSVRSHNNTNRDEPDNTPTRLPKIRKAGSQGSLEAFESLMSSPPERTDPGPRAYTGAATTSGALSIPAGSQSPFTTPRILPLSTSPILQRTLSEGEDALSKQMSPVQLSEEIRDIFNNSVSESDDEDLESIVSETSPEADEEPSGNNRRGSSTSRSRSHSQAAPRKTGIEMNEIATDSDYVPTIIQVMGPETGKSRYVSLAHLLGNVIVYQEFVKELTALIQVRSTLVDQVDYGWQKRSNNRRRR